MISYIDAGGASQKAGRQTKERNGDGDDDDDDDDSQVAPAAWGPHSYLLIYRNSILCSNLRALYL